MKNIKKILISSLILIVVGTLGLFLILFIGSLGTSLSNFDAGQGYSFSSEDMGRMSRGFSQSNKTIDLSFKDVEDLAKDWGKVNTLTENEDIAGMLSVNGLSG